MIKSSVFEIFRTFTPKELTKFEDAVNSPYFNKNKNVISLFTEIKKYAPEFNDDNLRKKVVWKKLFPDKEYNYGILKNLIFDLSKIAETFILFDNYSKIEFRKEYDLIEALGDRNIQKLTMAKLEQFEKRVKTVLENNTYYSIEDYFLIVSYYNYTKEVIIHINNLKLDKSHSIKKASEYLLYFFLVNSFKLINNTLSHELQGNTSIEKTLLEKFFLKLEEHSILEDLFLKENKIPDKLSKIITCFYYMYKAITSKGNIDAYNKFKMFLKDNIDNFSPFEMRNLNNCRIVCLANLKSTYLDSAKESFEWYKFLMTKNALLERNGLLTLQTMQSLVTNAVDLKEIDFAEKFLNTYSFKLPKDSRDNTFNYCMSVICFGKREFGKSLEFLTKINNEKIMLKYSSKIIYLKVYYELSDYESFIYSLDSFSHFKKRNKLDNETKDYKFNKFAANVRSLFKLKNSFDKYESEELRRNIHDNIGSDKKWLLEKIEELEEINK